MDKKQIILFISISSVIIIGGVVYYILSNKPSFGGNPSTGNPSIGNQAITNPPASAFPISASNNYNALVKNMQIALNTEFQPDLTPSPLLDDDGILGPLTTSAIQNVGCSVPVSQSDYTFITSK